MVQFRANNMQIHTTTLSSNDAFMCTGDAASSELLKVRANTLQVVNLYSPREAVFRLPAHDTRTRIHN